MSELSPELYRRWGLSLGRRLRPGAVVYVGGDVRTTTPPFLAALAWGFQQAGAAVRDLGIVPTPMVYFAQRRHRADACGIVTASHNPPSFNGLKWMLGELPPTEADVAQLQREAESANLGAPERPAASPPEDASVDEEYRDWLAEVFPPAFAGTVVLDPGNGCWAGRAGAILRRLHPRARVLSIHDRADGTFPQRDPDSARPANLKALTEAVVHERADLGIAFDGDGDRAAFVDDYGHALSAEAATLILLQTCVVSLRGEAFVYDIKFSDHIPQHVRGCGGRPCVERSGHAFIRARMCREHALFGAEISGHFFYCELEGGDDGMYSALRLLAHLADTGRSLGQLRRRLPPIYMSPDLRVSVAGDRQAIIAHAAGAFADLPQVTVDGVRVEFPGRGWALMRNSVTEPAITLRFEGRSPEALEEVVQLFCARLGDLGEPVRQRWLGAPCGSREVRPRRA